MSSLLAVIGSATPPGRLRRAVAEAVERHPGDSFELIDLAERRVSFASGAPLDSLANRIPASAGILEAIDDRSCTLRTGSQSVQTLAIHLMWLGIEFRVHEPPELIDHIRQLRDRLHRAGE